MVDSRPEEAVRPDDFDDNRLSQAMGALLGGAWPGQGGQAAAPAFTLPPPRRFDDDGRGSAEPASGIWDEPVPGEQSWAPAEAPAAAAIDGPAASDAPVPADDWWSEGEGAGATTPSTAADVEQPAPPDLAWAASVNDLPPFDTGGSGPDARDQAALQYAGLAGPMNTALSDLRRVGGNHADVTELAAPVAAGGYASSDRLAELRDWWSDRGRELLPGLAVAGVVVFAFAVVLLGRGSDSDGSKVNTGRATVSTVVPTSTPDLSAVSEPAADQPVVDEPVGSPLFSEPVPGGGSRAPAAKKPTTSPASRRPTSGAPAAGSNPSPSGGSPSGGSPAPPEPTPTAPPAPTPTASPATTVTTKPPPPTTPTTEPDTTPPRDRCDLVPGLCNP